MAHLQIELLDQVENDLILRSYLLMLYKYGIAGFANQSDQNKLNLYLNNNLVPFHTNKRNLTWLPTISRNLHILFNKP